MKARSSVKFIYVCDVMVIDEDGLLASSIDDQSEKHQHEGRIWISCVASEIVFQPLHPDTGALLHGERVVASNSSSEMLLMERGHFLFT